MEQSLYIVRHAHASDAEIDADRPLSAKGEKQIDRLCAALRGKGLIAPTLVWHSRYRRAIETAESLNTGLDISAPMEAIDGLTPYDDPAEIAQQINQSSENLMIVGHEPNLSSLASHFLSGARTFESIIDTDEIQNQHEREHVDLALAYRW